MKTRYTRRTRVITAVLAALALGTSLGHAQAAVFKDVQLESLHEAGRFAELEQLAKAMRSVGSLKELWIRTLELEPGSFTARVHLAKLYVTVPGMMGGSTSKAQELEVVVRSSQPEMARIIRVHIAGEAKKWAEMETELLALKPTKDAAMQKEVREATMQLALNFLRDGKDLAKLG